MRTLILLADSSRASLLFRPDQHSQIQVVQLWDNQAGVPSDSDIRVGKAAPTPAGGSQSGSGASIGRIKNSKRVFVQMLAETLRERLSRYDELVLIAAPKILGNLRKKLDETVRRRLIVELNKDLNHLSFHEIQPILEGLLGPR